MIESLAPLTDEEVQRRIPTDDEAGFGSLATERGHLPLLAMDVQARIDGLFAQVDLCQTFVNTIGEPLEATYIFPLPDRAAVTRFRMEVAGRIIEGVLQERAQARKEYEQAIQTGHRAAITEEERPDVFTMRVGNLMPGEQATVRLTLIGPLPTSDGEATFGFPLVVAPRYIPGQPLPGPSVGDGTMPDTDAVPDASRITPPVLLPGYPNPVRLSITVDVRSAGLPLSDFRSSLHAVLTEEEGQVRRIRLQTGERLDRDFILRFRLGDGVVKTALVLTPDQDGKEGTFALTIVPPAGQAALQPRDVVFVLDRSGSMGGWKMVAARRALARMVDTLTDRDRFSILAFDNAIETVPELGGVGLVAATDRNRYRAVEFLAKIEARGGTEMAQPLDLGVRQLTCEPGERDRILVLVTDGQVGNEDQILRSLASRVRKVRIFTLGIDQAVNESFLRRLATLGGGMSEVVESEDRLDLVMDKVHRRIGTPVLTGLRLEPAGLRFEPETLVPARTPDLFAGVPLCILGRYHGPAKGALALQARDSVGGGWAETVAATSSDNPAIASVWARGQIREMEDRFVSGKGDRAQLEKRIVETSLRFSVLCRFTAFMAVDRSEVVNASRQPYKIIQPVEIPSRWEAPICESMARIIPGVASGRVDPCVEQGTMGFMLTPTVKNFPVQKATRIFNASPQTHSTEPGRSVEETLMDINALTPETNILMEADRQQAMDLLSKMDRREAAVLRLRFGLDGAEPKTLKEIGECLGLTGERVLQIESEALRKLSENVQAANETQPRALPPPPLHGDLSAYRQRAHDLLNHLLRQAGKGAATQLGELGSLAVKLEALIEDLKSVGAGKAELRPLKDLLRKLKALLSARRPKDKTIAAAWSQAEAVLRAFGGTPAGRRESFWK
jgi:Ca-activated chloride channel family protein